MKSRWPRSLAAALVGLTFANAFVTAALSGLRTQAYRVIVGARIGLSLIGVQVSTLAALVHVQALHLLDWVIAGGGSLGSGVGGTGDLGLAGPD